MFEPKKEEVTREWRRLQKNELYDLHPSPNIIRVIKSRPVMGLVYFFTPISVKIGPSGISFCVFGKLGARVPERPDARNLLILQ
jgi:hypothetical protein